MRAPAVFAAFALVVAVVATSEPARAEDGAGSADEDASGRVAKGVFGLGLQLGEPTALCAKLYLADDRAISASIGSAFVVDGIQASVDYLFHPYILAKRDEFVIPFYAGPGVRVIDYRKAGDGSYGAVGARAVAGFLFDFKHVPIDAFAEAAFVLEYGFGHDHGVGVGVNTGVGARYYF